MILEELEADSQRLRSEIAVARASFRLFSSDFFALCIVCSYENLSTACESEHFSIFFSFLNLGVGCRTLVDVYDDSNSNISGASLWCGQSLVTAATDRVVSGLKLLG